MNIGPKTVSTESAIASIEELDLALADLELDDLEVTEPAEEIIEAGEPAITELDADGERALEMLSVKDEVYGDQEEGATMEASPAPKPRKAREAGAKAPKEPKVSKPKIERDLSALPDDLFQLSTDPDVDSLKDDVIALRPTQKKIAEKFDNLFQALNAGRAPSVYLMNCFKALDAAPGKSLSSKDMIALLTSTDKRTTSKVGSGTTYSQGTASSQVGQIMALFPVLGIATRAGSVLTLSDDSKIAERMRAL